MSGVLILRLMLGEKVGRFASPLNVQLARDAFVFVTAISWPLLHPGHQ